MKATILGSGRVGSARVAGPGLFQLSVFDIARQRVDHGIAGMCRQRGLAQAARVRESRGN